MNKFGYVRVSGKDQNEDRQMIAISEAGVAKEWIYIDKQSGKNFERTQYRKMIRRMRPGDVLIVKSIDRFGRNYEEIGNQWRLLTKDMGVDVVILDMPLLDTRRNIDGLIGTFIADLVLQIFSYVAHTERENILQRQREGIDAALLRGAQFGRPKMSAPPEFGFLREAWEDGRISLTACARALRVTRHTFQRWCIEADESNPEADS